MGKAEADPGRIEKGVRWARNIGRGIDVGTIGITAVVVALQPYHELAVMGFLMGEAIFENLKQGIITAKDGFKRNFRGSSSREASTLPQAA